MRSPAVWHSLEIEREAIKREGDEPKIAQLDKDIAELREQETQFRAKWEGERHHQQDPTGQARDGKSETRG